jgi:NAD(P)-dependent dehydrogenase (short-subunit alcohol dehydrogenase family)
VTGRTTRDRQSEYARPETIEETAELVSRAGGKGIAVRVDHLIAPQIKELAERIRSEQGRLDVLVNDIWGGENLKEWSKPVWDHDLQNGLRMLTLGVHTHLAKVAVTRMAWAYAKDLAPLGATSVAITPGWLGSEMMLDAFGVTKDNWRDAKTRVPHFVISETPRFVGRAVVALAANLDRSRWNRQSLSSGALAKIYGFTDVDGSRPDAWRYAVDVQDAGKPADATSYR